jgi:hypothetical protein
MGVDGNIAIAVYLKPESLDIIKYLIEPVI